MQSWRFTSDDYPPNLGNEALRIAVDRTGLTITTHNNDPPHVYLYQRLSAFGSFFTVIAGDPQHFHASERVDAGALLIVLHLDGRGALHNAEHTQPLKPGDFVIHPTGVGFKLSYESHFRQMWIRMPNIALKKRLLSANPFRSSLISGESAFDRVLSTLLCSVSEELHQIEDEELCASETAVTDFIAITLNHRQNYSTSASKITTLHRICQYIEPRLGDRNLNLDQVARDQRISPRYLQKLFESADENFTGYIRSRRLERCRAELSQVQDDPIPISDIFSRWGFTDAAHFSRIFRDKYGMSPRDYRKKMKLIQGNQLIAPHRGRPPQASDEITTTEDPTVNCDDRVTIIGQAKTPVHYIPVNAQTVHWGYFSNELEPIAIVNSGDTIGIETLTQHASDDCERMISGDPGAESVFHWTTDHKAVDRRGAGPMKASIFGRGAGEGFGVHIMTGPVAVAGAMPGDMIEVGIRDILPRPSRNPRFDGRCFGSNAAAWWGLHYNDLLTEPKTREVVTIYECMFDVNEPYAKAVYKFRWTPQVDPSGVVHPTIDYPGVPVDSATVEKFTDVLRDVTVPLRPHFGVIGCAPREPGLIDSIPPAYFGGNLDNWRLGKGARIFLPVSVPGALLSIGDPHASQGDAEIGGTAIECSLTGLFDITLHKSGANVSNGHVNFNYPMVETADEWVLFGFSHPDYLTELGAKAQSAVYRSASLDLAMKDAFHKMRHFLMTIRGLSEDEAISLMSVAVDFGISQVVDGNWAVHAILRKKIFDRDAVSRSFIFS